MRECRELEEAFETQYTGSIMRRSGSTVREMKEEICKQDRLKLVERCWKKAPIIADVVSRISWAKLWDATLDLGGKAVRGLQFLSRIMSHHERGNRPCQLCDAAPLPSSVLDHILDQHGEELSQESGLNCNNLLQLLEGLHLNVVFNFYIIIITIVCCFFLFVFSPSVSCSSGLYR